MRVNAREHTMSSFTEHEPTAVANDNQGGDAFIIETGGLAAGIVVREGRRFRFYSAHADFRSLDGHPYATPRAAQKAADLVRVAVDRRADARSNRWAVLTL
jgi:hypothetical protein